METENNIQKLIKFQLIFFLFLIYHISFANLFLIITTYSRIFPNLIFH